MNIAVVAYPLLEESERLRVEAMRTLHDPRASSIATHLTLVFPIDVNPDALVARTAATCRATRPIRFAIDRVEAVREDAGPGGHVFLVPAAGYRELAVLHDRLNDGVPRARASEKPFVPHITVGAYSDFERCRMLAQDLQATRLALEGTINRVEVIAVSPRGIESLASCLIGDKP